MAASVGYPAEVNNKFLTNLYQTGYDGDTVLLSWTPRIPQAIYSDRVYQYLKFLQTNPNRYDKYIITDVRDVYFQRNPSEIQSTDLDVFLEHGDVTIGECPYNSQWIYAGFGEEGLAKLRNKPISCGGTMVGTLDGMLRYCRSMIYFYDKATEEYKYMQGSDQGIHNWIIHMNHLKCRQVENEFSDIYTVGYVPMLHVKNHMIYNQRGELPAIIHQYDRHIREV